MTKAFGLSVVNGQVVTMFVYTVFLALSSLSLLIQISFTVLVQGEYISYWRFILYFQGDKGGPTISQVPSIQNNQYAKVEF